MTFKTDQELAELLSLVADAFDRRSRYIDELIEARLKTLPVNRSDNLRLRAEIALDIAWVIRHLTCKIKGGAK